MTRSMIAASVAAFVSAAFWTAQAQSPAAKRPVEPAPRLADGTPNLGRVPGEKGMWDVPYIQNMGMRIPGPDGKTAAERGTPAGGGRGGAKAEPDVPFLPWVARHLRLQLAETLQVRPGRLLPAPGGPRLIGDTVSEEIIQQAGSQAHPHDLRGATHICARFTWTAVHTRRVMHESDLLGHSLAAGIESTRRRCRRLQRKQAGSITTAPAHRPAATLRREIHAPR